MEKMIFFERRFYKAPVLEEIEITMEVSILSGNQIDNSEVDDYNTL